METNIKMDVKRNIMCSFALDSSGIGQRPLPGCCEHGTGRSVLNVRRFLDQLRYYWIVSKNLLLVVSL
jgi:hypothetical protein